MSEEKNIQHESHEVQAASDKPKNHLPLGKENIAATQKPLTSHQQAASVEASSDEPATSPQPTNMEVHKHPHHVTHKKNWGEYLLEFFMLFLAVFLGFLAENFREESIERHRELQFIVSFIEDLRSDTAAISSNVNSKLQKKEMKDSLIWYLNTPDPNRYSQRIYFFGRQLTRTTNFFPADRTIKQLKNSGGLRLIRDQQASDSILSYDQAVERFQLSQNRVEAELNDVRPMMGRLMNANVLETMITGEDIHPPIGNPPLRSVNREFLLDFIYAIHQLKGSDEVSSSQLTRLKEKASRTIRFLEQEYHLQ